MTISNVLKITPLLALDVLLGATVVAASQQPPLLFGDEPLPERDLYWTWSRRTNRWAVRRGDWKVVKYGPVSGRAWITGTHEHTLDPDDPWPAGYRVGDPWPTRS